MNIYLGNLTVADLEHRLGIELKKEEREELELTRQDNATVTDKDKWHCFDIPLIISCGSYDLAIKINEMLSPYADEMREQLQIRYDETQGEIR